MKRRAAIFYGGGALLIAGLAIAPFAAESYLPIRLANILGEWQSWFGVILGFIGLMAVTAYQLSQTRRGEQARRIEERRELIYLLYCEVYNRAARCALDARTWRGLAAKGADIDLSRFRKFRPVDPIVFRANASRLALLPVDVLAPLMMFYFRLDAVRRDVDKKPTMEVRKTYTAGPTIKSGLVVETEEFLDQLEVGLFARRLNDVAEPALVALESMAAYIDDRAALDAKLQPSHDDFLGSEDLVTALKTLISGGGSNQTIETS